MLENNTANILVTRCSTPSLYTETNRRPQGAASAALAGWYSGSQIWRIMVLRYQPSHWEHSVMPEFMLSVRPISKQPNRGWKLHDLTAGVTLVKSMFIGVSGSANKKRPTGISLKQMMLWNGKTKSKTYKSRLFCIMCADNEELELKHWNTDTVKSAEKLQ